MMQLAFVLGIFFLTIFMFYKTLITEHYKGEVLERFGKGAEIICPTDDKLMKISKKNGWTYDKNIYSFYKCGSSEECKKVPLTTDCHTIDR